MENPILTFLNKHKIPYEEYQHPALFTVEQAKAYENDIPWTHTKNIFIKEKKWPYHLITLVANKKLDTKVFKLQSGIKDFSFASPEDLMEQLKLTPGSVGIFWLINNPAIQLWIDQDVWSAESAGRHPNINTSTVILTKKWLQEYLNILAINYKIGIL